MVGEYNKNTILWKGRVVGLPARGGEGADYPCPYTPQVLGKILLKNSNLELVLYILVFTCYIFVKENCCLRCLVTGGAGFIGSHLVDRLLGGGHEVIVLDNFSTGHRQNLLQQGSRPGLTIHEGDVALLKAIQPLFEGVDWVFHLAALADIVPSIVRPLEYYRSNLDGTVVVLEASRQAGVKRFIYAASSYSY